MRRIAIWLAFMVLVISAQAQPIFSSKQVVICKRATPALTAPGDVSRASVVTMQFADAPLRQVLTEFGRQIDAGVEIQATNDGYAQTPSLDWVDTTRISVSVSRASYWEALRAVVQAVPIPLDPQGNEEDLVLVEHPEHSAGRGVAANEGVLAMAAAPGARRVGALLLAPMVLARNFSGTDEKKFVLAVAAEPRVHGFTAMGVLRLSELTSATGASLLGQQHEFVTDGERTWSQGYVRWSFELGEPPAGGVTVKTLRGDLRLGVGSVKGMQNVPLSAMFQPVPPVPGEIQVNEHCQIFRAPNFGVARGTFTSKDRSFPDECRIEGARHGIPDLEGGRLLPSERGHPVYTEERTLVFHNIRDITEKFVVWTTFPPDAVNYTSDPKPVKVQDHGEYYVVVQPGETVRLHIGYRVDQSQKYRQPLVAEVPLAAPKLWQTVNVDEARLTVKAVVPQAGEYVVRGEYSSPTGGPVAYACPRECQSLGLSDAAGRQILRTAAYGPIHREGNRDVMDWSLTTASRGLVPATLSYGLGTTKWVRVAVP